MAAVANGGRLVQPTIYARSGNNANESNADATTKKIAIQPATLAAVRAGLERVVNDPSGTAYSTARLQSIAIAGKTGTAENGTSTDQPRFAGYVPAAEPRLAFVVVLDTCRWDRPLRRPLPGRWSCSSNARYFPAAKVEVATQPEFPPGKG